MQLDNYYGGILRSKWERDILVSQSIACFVIPGIVVAIYTDCLNGKHGSTTHAHVSGQKSIEVHHHYTYIMTTA